MRLGYWLRLQPEENDDSLESKQPPNINNQPEQFGSTPWGQDPSDSELDDYICYKPLQDDMITPDIVYHLFSRFVIAFVLYAYF